MVCRLWQARRDDFRSRRPAPQAQRRLPLSLRALFAVPRDSSTSPRSNAPPRVMHVRSIVASLLLAVGTSRDDVSVGTRHNHGSKPMCNRPLLEWFLRTFNESSSTVNVLDVGGGRGGMGVHLRSLLRQSSLQYDCIDVVESDACPAYSGFAMPSAGNLTRDVVLFNFVLHHSRDGSTVSLLGEAKRISRRYVVVVEDLQGETIEEAQLNFAHDWRGVFRGRREWLQLFRLTGLVLHATLTIPRDCGHRDLPREVFVLRVPSI